MFADETPGELSRCCSRIFSLARPATYVNSIRQQVTGDPALREYFHGKHAINSLGERNGENQAETAPKLSACQL